MGAHRLTVAILLLASGTATADVRLATVFSDHMVLQRQQQTPVWGWDDPGAKVKVSIDGEWREATAGADGRWMVRLPAMRAGGPHRLVVQGSTRAEVQDVLIGEVWIASGQSNMAMAVRSVRDAEREIAQAKFPHIRMFQTQRRASTEAEADCTGRWLVCSPETVGEFSATAFFFGRELHQELKVPVGLLHSSWGGTAVEAWTSLEAQRSRKTIHPVLAGWDQQLASYDPAAAQKSHQQRLARWKQRAAQAKAAGEHAPRRPPAPKDPRLDQNRPGNLFNGMIHPLIPYGMRGAIWYQGERNRRAHSEFYGPQLACLIEDWRARWDQGDFPFIYVQLPNFTAKQTAPVQNDGWVLVRDGMLSTLQVPNTGMAVCLDLGEANDIHPKNKQDVGRRLARWALGATYERLHTYSGPLFESAAVRKVSGRQVMEISFRHLGEGLVAKGGGPLRGFAIAGKNGHFEWAEAKIVDGKVQVWSEKVPLPSAVRYAWAPNPDCNLCNRAGLPASPFRTD